MINALELLQNYRNAESQIAARNQAMQIQQAEESRNAMMAPIAMQRQQIALQGDQMRQNALMQAASGNTNALMALDPKFAIQNQMQRQALERQDRAERANEQYRQEQLRIERAKADPFGLMGGGQAGTPGINPGAPPIAGQPPAQSNPNAQPGSVLGAMPTDIHGDEFLKRLPPSVAGQVKALAEGKMAFPTGMALRSPIVQQLLGLVSQYDPTFDAVNYQGRNKTYTSFTGGADAEKVKNINQTLHHAGQLNDAIEKLDNFSGAATPLNYIVNPVEKAFGDPRQGVFEQKAQAVASELRKVYAGAGGGGLTELQKWESSLPVNASKEQQKAYLKSGMELLNGALSAMQEKYRAGMGPRADVGQLLKPEARAILQKLAPEALGGAASNGDNSDIFNQADAILGKKK